ncbi:MAG: hypothetical protein JWP98_795 [Edaphobacter sp.]|nr:hypothetical protein [Edaphobacter sp.]
MRLATAGNAELIAKQRRPMFVEMDREMMRRCRHWWPASFRGPLYENSGFETTNEMRSWNDGGLPG